MSTDMPLSQKEALAVILSETDAIPEEYRPLVSMVAASADDNLIAGLMADAIAARTLLETGDKEGARDIIEGYREVAEQAGLLPVFEQLLGGIIPDDDC